MSGSQEMLWIGRINIHSDPFQHFDIVVVKAAPFIATI